MKRSGVQRAIDDLKEHSNIDVESEAFSDAMYELSAEQETGGWVLEQWQLDALEDAGYALPTLDSDKYDDLHIVSLSDEAEDYLNELRADIDLDERLAVLD